MEKDTISEVLSRLPAKSLLRFESVSKGWRDLISNNSFRRLQCHRVKTVTSGFFFQDTWDVPYPVKYFSVKNDQAILQDTVLDFLPEMVELIASSNGLLCCKSCDDSNARDKLIYVCNPIKKEYVQIEWPKGTVLHQDFALAFDPFCYPVDELSNFKLACVCKETLLTILLQVYSSKTKEWSKLELRVCGDNYNCVPDGQVVFASGMLYWMTYGDVILAFDVVTEEFCFVGLPVERIYRSQGLCEVCIGESNDRLHFIVISEAGFQVWLMDSEPKWVLKHLISLSEMEEGNPHFLYNDAKRAARLVPDDFVIPTWIEPLVYKDGTLLVKLRCNYSYQNEELEVCTKIYLYNFETRTMLELFSIDKLGSQLGFLRALPYSMSLAPLGSA
ncbi:hypothetical protein IFM89_007009 [Coptis chinensis]|uniref:F-box domain-containing protein n=1 Tax=Coptis chinensis TaxID=261450 RepID=A0A835MA53_9MAGN|nr:hypothetical protein IFM89_007009 [Coptis chinensis]